MRLPSCVRACALTIALPTALSAATAERPLNVILILTDDVGYGDAGYTGNPILQTPAIDQLHSESICFDNFHTGTTSAPTRSGIMTGIDGNTTGVWHTIAGRSLLDRNLYTLGNLFQDNGYATAMYGKWHLGDNYPYRPIDRGFEDVLCIKGGGITQLPDYWGNTYFDDTYYRDRDIPERQTGYCTDIFVGETERFVRENRDKPFFVYLALNAAHSPFNIESKYVEPYKDKVKDRTARIYGMISNIDENLARLRQTLKEQGLDKNTVIILLGDNGSNVPSTAKDAFVKDTVQGYNGGLRGKKGQPYEGGHRQAMLMHIPTMKGGVTDYRLGMSYDFLPTFIDLCKLTPSREITLDGESLLSKSGTKGRVTFVDTQRGEYLVKGQMSCVMQDDWRLVNGKELYNIAEDREQRNNIAAEHPAVVKRLAAEYERWWEEQIAPVAEIRHSIPFTTDLKGESVIINSHDVHMTNNKRPVWSQAPARSGEKTGSIGFWSIEVTESGKYDFELYRWNPVTGYNLNEASKRGRAIPNGGKGYPEGKAITNMKSAALYFNGEMVASCEDFPLDRPSISMHSVKLNKGSYEFRALITDSEGSSYLPWFVKITKRK